MNDTELQKHMFSTYLTLRFGVSALALAFPILLYTIGRFIYGIPLEDSMSHYYFSLAPDDITERAFPMRVYFVGLLFAIGTFLYLYKGFTTKENIALNFAGLFAIGVAIFPMNGGCGESCPTVNLHGICAVLLFVCIAFVSLKCAKDTLHHLKNPTLESSYEMKYKILGAMMLAAPIIALVFVFIVKDFKKYTFFVEAAGVWAFALYWWVKSTEMSHSSADQNALSSN